MGTYASGNTGSLFRSREEGWGDAPMNSILGEREVIWLKASALRSKGAQAYFAYRHW